MNTGLILDILIIVLLVATTGFSILLNHRLGALRRGQAEFVKLMGRFDDAAARAETNIVQLRGVGVELDESLGDRITTARSLRDELRFLIDRAAPAGERIIAKTEADRRQAAAASNTPRAPFAMTPANGDAGPGSDLSSVVEADLLEALREARKG